jgi:hypothetical protein
MLKSAFFAAVVFIGALATTTHVRATAASTTATYNSVTQTYSYTYTYNNTDPNDSDIWDYVGSDNGASAVYLGDGYVLSAGHVGAHNFILDGYTYNLIGSSQGFGTADLSLFKIDTTSTTGHLLTLPTLSLETTAPSVGNSVVMIGYGNSQGETWATNTIYETGQNVQLTSPSFDSTDFFTVDNFSPDGPNTTITHNGQLVPGDSGGGDFIYDASSGKWELAGINEVQLEDGSDHDKIVGSGMVQISQYAGAINADVPEPPTWIFLGLGLFTVGAMHGLGMRFSPARVDSL